MLPFSIPPYVKASKRSIENSYIIGAIGLKRDSVSGVLIDEKIALEQIHTTYFLMLIPLSDSIKIDYEDALFYADCFAYEHEIPVIAYPKRCGKYTNFILDGNYKKDISRKIYFDELTVSLESIVSLRLGPLGCVEFRYDTLNNFSPLDPAVNLNYSRKYFNVRKELHLYSFALRQVDPLSEFLCYYRVIESATNSDGEKWLSENLGRLESEKFGFLPAGVGDGYVHKRRINLFTVLRRRALARIRSLKKSEKSNKSIAKKLYRESRCGIAHGKKIRRADFGIEFEDIYLDCFIIKLMARIAIECKRNHENCE